jgi:hypothetical protein
MACTICQTDLVVVKCPYCETPFVAPDILSTIPCVSCGKKFSKQDRLVVSSRQEHFFLINEDVTEAATFSQRLKWKRPTTPIHVITQYYVDDSKDRQAEIDLCLAKNILNEYIDKIHVFLDDETVQLPQFALGSSKIVAIRLSRRLKFKDAFNYCDKNLSNEICVVANSGSSKSPHFSA